MENENDSDLVNKIENDFNALESYYDICLNHLEEDNSQEAVRRLLLFTESTVDILNRYAKKNPILFKELVQFKKNWPGMISSVKVFQEKYDDIATEIGVGSFINLKGSKEDSAPKAWAIRLLNEIYYRVRNLDNSAPFNKDHLEKWKEFVEHRLDLEYGTKSIRLKKYIEIFLYPKLVETFKAGLTERFSDDEESEAPCILSDPYIKRYCDTSLGSTYPTAGTRYRNIKSKILGEIERLAP